MTPDEKREARRVYNVTYRAANAERLRAYDADRYAANPEKMRAYARGRRAANPERMREVDARANARRYGTTSEVLAELLALQGGVCAICRTVPATPHTDHSHVTGAVRGVLCGNCNTGLGMLGDDPQRLRWAIAYLEARTSS